MEVVEGVEGARRLFLKHQKKVLWAGELVEEWRRVGEEEWLSWR